jgi:hypothetical protein
MHGRLPSEARNGAAMSLPLSDERMDQVREILFGDYRRQCEQQFAALEARLLEMQAAFNRRFEELEARLAGFSADARAGQRAAFAELARDVGELGERIRALSRG